jgi:hypothetical protein
LFFENFNSAATMTPTPRFNEDNDNYFGLVGGSVANFGSDWDGDLSDLDIPDYLGG